jgi:hypothetical protein
VSHTDHNALREAARDVIAGGPRPVPRQEWRAVLREERGDAVAYQLRRMARSRARVSL